MGMCSSTSDPNLGIAALTQATAESNVGMRQLDLSEKQFESSQAMQREYLDLIKGQQPMQDRLMESQADAAELALERQANVQYPLEDQIIAEATNYDSADRINNEAGKADAAVIAAYDKAQASAGREMRRMGIDPNSGKAVAQRENNAISLASAAANASSTAAEQTKAKGFAMRMDAAGLGRNLGLNSTANADSALRAGQAQATNQLNAQNASNSSFSTAMSGFGNAGSSFSSAARTYTALGAQQSQEAANENQSTGAIVGAGLGALGRWGASSYAKK